MDNLVERLRGVVAITRGYADASPTPDIVEEAADKIEELETKLAKLEPVECPDCGGEGYHVIDGSTPGCCGNVAPDGSCYGHCSVAEHIQEQQPCHCDNGKLPATHVLIEVSSAKAVEEMTAEFGKIVAGTHVIVPLVPTEKMLDAGFNVKTDSDNMQAPDIYKAMISVQD